MSTKAIPEAADGIQILDNDDGNFKAASLGSLPVSTLSAAAIALKLNSAFVPGQSSDWDGDPATVQEAIDRMAALLFVLNTNTAIP